MKTITITRVLTKAEIDALNTGELTIVENLGASTIILPRHYILVKKGGAAATTGTGSLVFQYDGGAALSTITNVDASGGIFGSTADRTQSNPVTCPVAATSAVINKDITIKSSAAIVAGAGTTLQVTIICDVIDVRS